jgi:hypothetical protein
MGEAAAASWRQRPPPTSPPCRPCSFARLRLGWARRPAAFGRARRGLICAPAPPPRSATDTTAIRDQYQWWRALSSMFISAGEACAHQPLHAAVFYLRADGGAAGLPPPPPLGGLSRRRQRRGPSAPPSARPTPLLAQAWCSCGPRCCCSGRSAPSWRATWACPPWPPSRWGAAWAACSSPPTLPARPSARRPPGPAWRCWVGARSRPMRRCPGVVTAGPCRAAHGAACPPSSSPNLQRPPLAGAAICKLLYHRQKYRYHWISGVVVAYVLALMLAIGATPFVDNWCHLGGLGLGAIICWSALIVRRCSRGLRALCMRRRPAAPLGGCAWGALPAALGSAVRARDAAPWRRAVVPARRVEARPPASARLCLPQVRSRERDSHKGESTALACAVALAVAAVAIVVAAAAGIEAPVPIGNRCSWCDSLVSAAATLAMARRAPWANLLAAGVCLAGAGALQAGRRLPAVGRPSTTPGLAACYAVCVAVRGQAVQRAAAAAAAAGVLQQPAVGLRGGQGVPQELRVQHVQVRGRRGGARQGGGGGALGAPCPGRRWPPAVLGAAWGPAALQLVATAGACGQLPSLSPSAARLPPARPCRNGTTSLACPKGDLHTLPTNQTTQALLETLCNQYCNLQLPGVSTIGVGGAGNKSTLARRRF